MITGLKYRRRPDMSHNTFGLQLLYCVRKQKEYNDFSKLLYYNKNRSSASTTVNRHQLRNFDGFSAFCLVDS